MLCSRAGVNTWPISVFSCAKVTTFLVCFVVACGKVTFFFGACLNGGRAEGVWLLKDTGGERERQNRWYDRVRQKKTSSLASNLFARSVPSIKVEKNSRAHLRNAVLTFRTDCCAGDR